MNRIGIIGDVHAEHERLAAALEFLASEGVDGLICTGDLPDGVGDLDVCCELLQGADVLTVAGNHDRWFLQDRVRHVQDAHLREKASADTIRFIESLPKVRTLQTAAGALMLCHGVLEDDLAKIWPGSERSTSRCSAPLDALLQETNPPRFVINGHMHFRTVIDFPSTQVINGGTLKGQYAGFSLLDVDSGQIDSFNFSAEHDIELARQLDLDAHLDRRVWRNTDDFDGQWQPVVLHSA
jgi:predicted phosphodiesterase